jgi:hypothetical protein
MRSTRLLAGLLTAIFLLSSQLTRPRAAAAAEEAKPAEAKPAAPALAENSVAKVQQLNRTAMQYYDDLNFAMAEKTLLEALAIVEKENLGGGPALATHGNLAVLYSVGFKKPDKAVIHFKKALAIKPDLKMSKQRAAPETEANLARARAEMSGGGAQAAAAKSSEVAPPAEGGDFRCPASGEITAGDDITLKCQTASNLQPATVMLYYRTSTGQEYEVQRMSKEGTASGTTTWAVKIPAPRTQGTSLYFYFEANDPSGNSLATSGTEEAPSVISVKGGEAVAQAGPPPVAEGGEEEGDDEEEEGEEIDDNNPLAALERERWREHEGSKGTWWIGLGFGSGIGYASGGATEAFGKRYGVAFKSGFAPAALGHAVPEIGYFIGRKTALALTGRDQWVTGGPAGTATGAHAVLLRALFFTDDAGKVRWYFATAAGAGEAFRLQVTAAVHNNGAPTNQTVKDTVLGGPFVVGTGAGMLYKLSRRWRWSVDTQVLVGFGHVSAVLDLTTGIRWQF